MSIRRSISFKETEDTLLNYYDKNGKSDIAKDALKFYIKNKDKIIINNLGELAPLLNNNTNNTQKEIPKKVNNLIR